MEENTFKVVSVDSGETAHEVLPWDDAVDVSVELGLCLTLNPKWSSRRFDEDSQLNFRPWKIEVVQVCLIDETEYVVPLDTYGTNISSDNPKIVLSESMIKDILDEEYRSDSREIKIISRTVIDAIWGLSDIHTGREYDATFEEVFFETEEGGLAILYILDILGIKPGLVDFEVSEYSIDDLSRPKKRSNEDERWYANRDSDATAKNDDESDDETAGASVEKLRETFVERLDGHTSSSYVYVLLLRDKKDGDPAYYVGKSSQPFSRMKTHAKKNGDFSGSSEYNVVRVDDVYSDMSESEVYSIVSKQTDDTTDVLGGK